MGVEGDTKVRGCGDRRQDTARRLLVLETVCAHVGVCVRESGGMLVNVFGWSWLKPCLGMYAAASTASSKGRKIWKDWQISSNNKKLLPRMNNLTKHTKAIVSKAFPSWVHILLCDAFLILLLNIVSGPSCWIPSSFMALVLPSGEPRVFKIHEKSTY